MRVVPWETGIQEQPCSDIMGLASDIIRGLYCHAIQVSSQISVEAACWTRYDLVSSKEAVRQ